MRILVKRRTRQKQEHAVPHQSSVSGSHSSFNAQFADHSANRFSVQASAARNTESHPGPPHGIPTPHAAQINADLLSFVLQGVRVG